MATIKKTYPIIGMSCAVCSGHVEKALNKQQGVQSASVNLAAATANVEFDSTRVSPAEIQKAVRDAGYDMLIDEADSESDRLEQIRNQEFEDLKKRTIWAIILALPIAIIGMFFMNMPYANYIMWALSTIVLFVFGRSFYINAFKLARHGKSSMDTLVALSTAVAYIFSVFNILFPDFWLSRGITPHVYFEAAAVIIAFILLGKFLEEKAKGNTSTALRKLIGLQPKMVTVVNGGPIQIQTQIPISKVVVGNLILVKPGEKIAVDGIVINGASYVDESMLSGEPIPVHKEKDSKVFAGTINQKGSFMFKAEKVGADTMLSHIIQMVQDAQGSKAPVQKLVDKIASIFVPAVIIIAILSFVIWMILGGDNAFSHALLALITVLVIACPCALGLATPTAIMVGIGKGAENGILIKDAESLERSQQVTAVVLDKTGTITEGKPEVTNISWLNEDDSLKHILWNIEKKSEHPLANAIVAHLKDISFVNIVDFEAISGKGAKGRFEDQVYWVGNKGLLIDNKIDISPTLFQLAAEYEQQTQTVVWFADSEKVLAIIAISDRIKATSKEAISQLQKMNIEVYMLTGDNEATARAIASQVGIQHYKASVLPQDKEKFIRELQAQGKVVAMVGDGINDSAALARADVSIAMGGGSDIAMEVAKITIISSDLSKIPSAIKLSKQTVRTIRQNLFWAFIYNLIGIPIAGGILYPINVFLLNPMIAGAAMALSSVSVVSNSLRLKWKKL